MNAEEPQADDESILTHLVACDEALAAGKLPHESSDTDPPKEQRPRLEGDLAFIQVLRKVLPRRSTGATPGAPPTQGQHFAATDLPFQELGHFQIRRRLGQGAFGIVFLAFDPRLGREVALKVPRPEALLTGELRERFLREARAAAGLDHPNLVPLYEAGTVGPLCYIASAYCPGVTLSEWLKERTELPPERLAAALVARLADAVGHAHSRGVIHRDLKPSNVLLQGRRHDAADANSTLKEPLSEQSLSGTELEFVPRITDFGLAKLIGDGTAQHGDGDGLETRTGAVLGTPNYMAPEQASGKNKEIGPAADVYALGGILYELLTGRVPFRGESLLDTLEQVRTREPVPPARLHPKLSRDLETICLKCLEKEPPKRYETAAALAEDLRRYQAGEPIHARPIRAWERGLKWARRRPALAFLWLFSIVGPLLLASVVLAYNARLREAFGSEQVQRQRAEAGEWEARNFSYVSDMNLAQQDWAGARISRLSDLLQRQVPPPGMPDLRGFEWYYWNRLLHRSARQTLRGHTRQVWCVACSPDGKLLASGGRDRTVRLWDVATGRTVRELKQFGQAISSVAFAESGRTLVVASGKRVFVCDLIRKQDQIIRRGGATVMAVAVADRPRFLALACFDGSVEIWDVEKGVLRDTLRRHKEHIWAIVFSPDNKTLASAGDDGLIHLWDVAPFKWRASYSAHRKSIYGLAFAPDGMTLASASEDGTVSLWDMGAGKERAILVGHTQRVWSVHFAPDGKMLVSASADATVRLWDVASGAPRLALKGHKGEVRGAVFLPHGHTIVSAGTDGDLKLWDPHRNPDSISWSCHDPMVDQLAFTTDGRVMATSGRDRLVKLWEVATGRQLEELPPFPKLIQGLAFAPDGKHLAVASLDPLVDIYDRQTAKIVARFAGHAHEVSAITSIPEGNLLASGDMGGSIHVWDWQTRREIAVCTCNKPGDERVGPSIQNLAFSRDGKLLASGGADSSITLWEPETGQLLKSWPGHEKLVTGLAFSPDGRTLASGSDDHTVCLWDVATGDLKWRMKGHVGPVSSLAFSPDGRTLASTSAQVKLWQTATGRELATFTVPGAISCLAWQPHGQLLAGGGVEGSHGVITLWSAQTAAK